MAPDTLTAQDSQSSAKTPAERCGGPRGAKRGAARPWALAVALAIPLSVIYLIVQPPSGDLAAATYRGEVFARAGFTLWDNGWYSGHYLPGYSLLAPALGALAGERLLLALCTVAAAGLFGVLADRAFEAPGARVAALSFALGACVTMLSGRVAFGLGLAVGLLALVALQRGRPGAALALAVLTSFASPVAGAFLALAGLAYALAAAAPRALVGEHSVEHSVAEPHARMRTRARWARTWHVHRQPGRPDREMRSGRLSGPAGHPEQLSGGERRSGLALMVAALAPILLLTLAFPEGGWEPFAPSVFWPALAGVVAIAVLLPRVRSGLTPPATRALAWGAWLYACALIGSYALHTPVGSNAARLGELFAAPLVAGALSPLVAGALRKRRPPTTNEPPTANEPPAANEPPTTNERPGSPVSAQLRRLLVHPLALLALAPVLLYWQLETPINDVSSLAGDPSVNASYYAPLLGELQRRAHGAPLRVEVALTGAHWESAYLPERGSIVLARGWERQLDTRYAALFYAPTLGAAAYRTWLYENAVSYVAVPDVRLDFAGEAEGRLIAHGVPYLSEVWHSPHWRLFAVTGALPLAQPPALLTALGAGSFTLAAPRPGDYEVRVRFTPYWALETGRGCVRSARGGWTAVQARRAGTIRVGIDFALTRIFSQGPRCT